MRWDRWSALRRGDERWRFGTIDASDLSAAQVAAELLAWARDATGLS